MSLPMTAAHEVSVKITILQEIVYSGDFDVAGICETWLNKSFRDSKILRRDREDLGGGVILAVKGNIQASRRLDLETEDLGLVVVEHKIVVPIWPTPTSCYRWSNFAMGSCHFGGPPR